MHAFDAPTICFRQAGGLKESRANSGEADFESDTGEIMLKRQRMNNEACVERGRDSRSDTRRDYSVRFSYMSITGQGPRPGMPPRHGWISDSVHIEPPVSPTGMQALAASLASTSTLPPQGRLRIWAHHDQTIAQRPPGGSERGFKLSGIISRRWKCPTRHFRHEKASPDR